MIGYWHNERMACVYLGGKTIRIGWWTYLKGPLAKPFICSIRIIIDKEGTVWKVFRFRLWRFQIDWKIAEVPPTPHTEEA